MIIDDQREFLVETLIYILPLKGDGFAAQVDAVWRRDVGNTYRRARSAAKAGVCCFS